MAVMAEAGLTGSRELLLSPMGVQEIMHLDHPPPLSQAQQQEAVSEAEQLRHMGCWCPGRGFTHNVATLATAIQF